MKNAGVFKIIAKGGNDKITVSSGKSGSRIDAGPGTDSVKVTGGKIAVLTLRAGKNTVDITGGTVKKITATKMTHKTMNEITVQKQKNITINMTDGRDTITVNGIHNEVLSKASKAKILTRSDDDIITINKGGLNRIDTGLGKDKVTVNGGSNYVYTSGGRDTIVVNSKYGNYINASSENDTIKLGKNARFCVVEGGADSDTITVKSKGSGKIGNLIQGGGGKDTYNIYYNGQTIVLDAKTGSSDAHDILNIHADYSILDSLTYFKKNDVLEINGNARIIGFSKLEKINLKTPEYDFFIVFTPKEVIGYADEISDKAFDINGLLKPYNGIKNALLSGSSRNNTNAKYMGYKGWQ